MKCISALVILLVCAVHRERARQSRLRLDSRQQRNHPHGARQPARRPHLPSRSRRRQPARWHRRRDIPLPSPWPGPTNGMPRCRIPTLPQISIFFASRSMSPARIYECHLPSERPMIITFRDERRPEKPVVTTIGVILGPCAQQFISPNDLHIQYYSWNCVDNCVLPCFDWRRILNEKYDVTPVPKVYSLMTPDHDDQKLSVKIKSPIPLTVALLPSHLADQVYDKTVSLTDGARPNRMQRTRRAVHELQLQLQRRQRLANAVHPSRDQTSPDTRKPASRSIP